jgi:uncharacterized protein (DUF1501 family)
MANGMTATTRRSFLKTAIGSASLVSLAPFVPQFLLTASARAAEQRGESVLVVIQLSGGNDGLNTVIPYADDAYRRGRPSLGIGADRALKIDDYVGFHPSMSGFARLLEDGKLGIVQGVGYPNPDRSHFSSMDIWHTARPQKDATAAAATHRATGWLGRLLDAQVAPGTAGGSDVPGLHLGSGQLPLALLGGQPRAASIGTLDGFKLNVGGNADVRRAVEAAASARRDDPDGLLDFLQRGAAAALRSSQQVQEAIGTYTTSAKYPETELAQRLKTVAQLIDAGLETRVYYVELTGFDTHANQGNVHANLLAELSDAVAAFVKDLDEHGHGRRVLTMTFSEFGRRVRENASQGTDHGAAAPMFVAGGGVKPGLIGKHPSLTDLDEDDLKFTTDFRGVYAAVLKDWLGVPGEAVLGASFAPVSVTAS